MLRRSSMTRMHFEESGCAVIPEEKSGSAAKLASVTNSGFGSLSSSRKRLLARFVNQMSAAAFELTAERLLRADRGQAQTARARQVSIYLMNTVLSFSLMEIAKVYGKDRTTVGHACRVVEDLRDKPSFDDRILELEEAVKTVLALATFDIEGNRNDKIK